jgi:spermidine synthase
VRIAVLAFGISGFVNMSLQLGWTRVLVLSIGNSTYAFSVIVGVFIFGLAAGGWIAGLFTDRLRDPTAAFGWVLVATAVTAGLTIPWLGLSPARFAWGIAAQMRTGEYTFWRFLLGGRIGGAGDPAFHHLHGDGVSGCRQDARARLSGDCSRRG